MHTAIPITWPALIHFADDDDLLYIADSQHWATDNDLNQADYQYHDVLIDSKGQCFSLVVKHTQPATFVARDTLIPLSHLNLLLQKFATLENYCCAAKIHANTHLDAIMMVNYFETL
jgi:hypothetical protein